MVIAFILNSKWDSLILEFKHNIYQNQVYLFFLENFVLQSIEFPINVRFVVLVRHKILQYCVKPSPQKLF